MAEQQTRLSKMLGKPFELVDAESREKPLMLIGTAIGAGVVIALVLALMPDSARTVWGDFLIAAGTFLVAQLARETHLSLRHRLMRRAVTRALLAAVVVGGLIAAVMVPGGEQESVSADPVDDVAEFIEENIIDPIAVGGAVATGAKIGNDACGARCARAGAVAGAFVGIAITNTRATVQAAKDTGRSVTKAAKATGRFLDNAGGPPKKVVQRDSAASTPNLPRGNVSTPNNSSPQPTCQAGYGVHGRSTCSWK